MEIDVIGVMEGAYEMPNRVYGKEGLAPSIRTFQGGSLEPKVIDVKKLGNASNGNTQSRSVYDENGLCPTLCAGMGPKGNTMPMIVDVVAMRGRDPDNPSDRTPGNPNLEQRLEVNSEGICNCLTTVQKDNMVVEAECLRMVRTEEGKRLRKEYESHEIQHGFNEHREAEPRTDGCSNTITTVQKDNMIVESMLGNYLVSQNTAQGYVECVPGGVADLSYPTSKTRRGRVIENGEISPTLTTTSIPSVLEDRIWEVDGVRYLVRIRKLTPKECWRLMGCSDEDFEKAASVNSNTQLYKQAGNSIVVDVLENLFKELIYGEETEEYAD